MLILIEGANCVGKTTFLKNLQVKLSQKNISSTVIHSPTSCDFFEDLIDKKNIFHDKKYSLFHQILSFVIAHNFMEDHVKKKSHHDIIFFDRSAFFSGIIYQCFCNVEDMELIFSVSNAVTLLSSFSKIFDFVKIDMCFLLCETKNVLIHNLAKSQKNGKNIHLSIEVLMHLQESYIQFFKNCFFSIFDCPSTAIISPSTVNMDKLTQAIVNTYKKN